MLLKIHIFFRWSRANPLQTKIYPRYFIEGIFSKVLKEPSDFVFFVFWILFPVSVHELLTVVRAEYGKDNNPDKFYGNHSRH